VGKKNEIGRVPPTMSLNSSTRYPVRIRWGEEDLLYPWTLFDLPHRSLPFPPLQQTISEWAALVNKSTSGQPVNLEFGPGVCETGKGQRNCTEACSNPAYFFRPMNFQSCLLLAGTARLIQQENYALDTEDKATAKTIEAWGDFDLSTFNVTQALSNISGCVSEECNESDRQDCIGFAGALKAMSDPANSNSFSEMSSSLNQQIAQYCSITNIRTDPDIAGPGVRWFPRRPEHVNTDPRVDRSSYRTPSRPVSPFYSASF